MVLERLKSWLFGAKRGDETDEATASDSETESASESESFRCGVCGTAVESPSKTCPLCGSSDIETGDVRADASPPPAAGERVENDGDDPAERLRETRATLLEAHDEKWEETSDGYRVQRPDGEWRSVANEDAVRAVLREH